MVAPVHESLRASVRHWINSCPESFGRGRPSGARPSTRTGSGFGFALPPGSWIHAQRTARASPRCKSFCAPGIHAQRTAHSRIVPYSCRRAGLSEDMACKKRADGTEAPTARNLSLHSDANHQKPAPEGITVTRTSSGGRCRGCS